MVAYLHQNQVRDVYWEDKRAHPEWINVPTYVVASWTNAVHTPGTFKGFSLLHPTVPKWLRVHNKMEWPDYYDDNSQRDLKRFFDYYLHGVENGWTSTPTVRLSVLHMGLKDRVDTINRPESEFPLERTKYTKYFLHTDKTLSMDPYTAGEVSYNAVSGEKCIFTMQMPSSCETTGYFMAHLVMSSATNHHELDVFVQVENLNSKKRRQGTMCLNPQGVVPKTVLKLVHDWQIGLGTVGMAFHWGPDGQLRASHALGREENSRPAEPEYMLKEKKPLTKGEVQALDIPMRPYGMFWEVSFTKHLLLH